ncbi:hypothetical protein GBA52_015220 [Prunus armeniaca]|nr:hypothetical protein GBA52_015220 [Prunus armeniaca]
MSNASVPLWTESVRTYSKGLNAKAILSTASSALEAEAQAILQGYKLAHDLDCTSVVKLYQ